MNGDSLDRKENNLGKLRRKTKSEQIIAGRKKQLAGFSRKVHRNYPRRQRVPQNAREWKETR